MKNSNRKLKENLEFARRTEEAWKEIDAGKCIKMTSDEFIKEIKCQMKLKRR